MSLIDRNIFAPKELVLSNDDKKLMAQIACYFEMYQHKILPLIKKVAIQEMTGPHGLETHTDSVVFRGIDYVLHLKEKPLPVIYACALHDVARVNDEGTNKHAYDAVPIALNFLENITELSQQEKEQVVNAVKMHTDGEKADDYISACLWDADRTRLAWMWGYNEKYFSTKRAKEVASGSFFDYLKFQNMTLKRPYNEDREEVFLFMSYDILLKYFPNDIKGNKKELVKSLKQAILLQIKNSKKR